MSHKRKGGRREIHRIRIVSEGTPATTRVYLNGFLVSGVTEVAYKVGVGGFPVVHLTILDADIDALGDLTEVKVEHRPGGCPAKSGFGVQCSFVQGHPDDHAHLVDGRLEVWT